MNASSPMQIGGASRELRRLEKKIREGEELDVLEQDDLEVLREFVAEYNTDYMMLDYEGRVLYELWAKYLADQRTMSGSLIVEAVFKVMDRTVGQGIEDDEYERLFDMIKEIDDLAASYGKKEEEPRGRGGEDDPFNLGGR